MKEKKNSLKTESDSSDEEFHDAPDEKELNEDLIQVRTSKQSLNK